MKEGYKLAVAISVAAALWFCMFSPWTSGLFGFWQLMPACAALLTALAVCFGAGKDLDHKTSGRIEGTLGQILIGIGLAFALWGIFWVGDKLSSLMFGFARQQVDSVYSMKEGTPTWLITILLLLVIGPAEEFFWRGFVQRKFTEILDKWKYPADHAFLFTTLIYSLIHIWSFNFMLVMAALVAGAVWGFIYRLRPGLLPALVISHALWDALVFVILPV